MAIVWSAVRVAARVRGRTSFFQPPTTLPEDPLIALVRRYVSLSTAQAAQITAAWGAPRICRPGEVFLLPGQTCRALYFMDEGYARFYAEPGGRDVTRHFVLPGLLFTVAASFASGTPARDGLQALTPGRVRQLSREANATLAVACPPWNDFREAYIRAVYAYLDDTLDEARYLSATERYEAFVHRYPDVLLHIPLHHVASYLGMTPQSLSRVRAKGLT
ncbi:MAG: Crp/Fnr family transcriptional regulator [Bacteroidota bacterium]